MTKGRKRPTPVTAFAWSDTGRLAVVRDDVVALVEPESGQETTSYDVGAPVENLAFGDDVFVYADGAIRALGAARAIGEPGVVGDMGRIYLAPDARHGVRAKMNDITLFDVATRRERLQFQSVGSVPDVVAFSRGSTRAAGGNVDGMVQAWDYSTGRFVGSFDAHSEPPRRTSRRSSSIRMGSGLPCWSAGSSSSVMRRRSRWC